MIDQRRRDRPGPLQRVAHKLPKSRLRARPETASFSPDNQPYKDIGMMPYPASSSSSLLVYHSCFLHLPDLRAWVTGTDYKSRASWMQTVRLVVAAVECRRTRLGCSSSRSLASVAYMRSIQRQCALSEIPRSEHPRLGEQLACARGCRGPGLVFVTR
ncbi:hypothetical protein ARMGADRAFT_1009964 [Armillaria gallica]|uniref:Uncharacterized protein n=1 Tax=Armillaria gallica TaxID=47427 RepID=A0A2H3E6U6_ARMGA|nr:hypothetical protein ARMGADRAFT_1009964 [Armillaria gallica]